jgi:hypothetical protein
MPHRSASELLDLTTLDKFQARLTAQFTRIEDCYSLRQPELLEKYDYKLEHWAEGAARVCGKYRSITECECLTRIDAEMRRIHDYRRIENLPPFGPLKQMMQSAVLLLGLVRERIVGGEAPSNNPDTIPHGMPEELLKLVKFLMEQPTAIDAHTIQQKLGKQPSTITSKIKGEYWKPWIDQHIGHGGTMWWIKGSWQLPDSAGKKQGN